jgi:FlaG/FlaF family flagellin (archaellin)
MKFMKNDDAVSPVIGVILMVAITVIIAAIVAAFAFGMADDIQKTKVIAATASQSGSNILVTYYGGPDAHHVINMTVTTSGGTGVLNNITGSSLQLGGGTSGHDRVVAAAIFDDGTSQVILDTYV